MSSKSKTRKNISPINNSLYEVELLDLDKLKRGELQKIAKQLGLSATAKSETIKKNISNYIIKSKLSKTTRLDTQLPREIQDLVFEKVYDMANPEIEAQIKTILDKGYRVGDDNMTYDYSKIRKKLKIKHNIKPKELLEKVENFRHIYVRMGVIYHYFEIKEITEYFEINPQHLTEEDFDVYSRKLYNIEIPLRRAIDEYNKRATKLKKDYGSYFDPEYIDEVNDLIKHFRKVAKYDKKVGKIPFLKYGSMKHSRNSLSITKKSRLTKSDIVSRSKSFTRRRSRLTRSI